MFKPPLVQGDNLLETYDAKGYRARITDAKISLSFVAVLLDKVIMYFISWIIRVFLYFKFHTQERVHKGWLTAMFWWPKVHMLLFNLNLMDFLFYGNRAASHYKIGSSWNQTAAILILMLLNIDFYILLGLIYNDELWYAKYRQKKSDSVTQG